MPAAMSWSLFSFAHAKQALRKKQIAALQIMS
jgi:hypothetical protein